MVRWSRHNFASGHHLALLSRRYSPSECSINCHFNLICAGLDGNFLNLHVQYSIKLCATPSEIEDVTAASQIRN
jgi:hypothetical protein